MNWPAQMRTEAENGRDPAAVGAMPACRYIAIFYPPTGADIRTMVNEDRAAAGKPLLEMTDEEG